MDITRQLLPPATRRSLSNLSNISNMHLWDTCPLISTELQYGTSVLQQVHSSSSKRCQTEPWSMWLTLRLQVNEVNEDLGPSNSDFQTRRLPGRERWEKVQLYPLLGNFLEVCRQQSGSSFPVDPQVWLQFYQQTCFLIAAGKQYWGQFLLDSRLSGGAPAVVIPGGSWAGAWLTDSLPTQYPQSSRSSFTQLRTLGDWITWTCIHSKTHSLLSLLET